MTSEERKKFKSEKVEVICIECKKVYTITNSTKEVALKKKGFIICNPCAKTKWTHETIQIEALKYTRRIDFHTSCPAAYGKANKLNILDLVCTHMLNFYNRSYSKLTNKTGVYFLYQENKIVYIGKSTSCLSRRLMDHTTDTNKEFNRIMVYIIANTSDIAVIEPYFINKFKPKYNREGKSISILSFNIDKILYNCIDEEIHLDKSMSEAESSYDDYADAQYEQMKDDR